MHNLAHGAYIQFFLKLIEHGVRQARLRSWVTYRYSGKPSDILHLETEVGQLNTSVHYNDKFPSPIKFNSTVHDERGRNSRLAKKLWQFLSLQSPVTAIFGRLECDWLIEEANRGRCWINQNITRFSLSRNTILVRFITHLAAFVCALFEVHSNIGTNYCKSR